VGTLLIFVLGMVQVFLYGWVFGIERGEVELHQGAHIRVPRVVQYILKYVSPLFLGAIFIAFCINNVPTYMETISRNPVALLSIFFLLLILGFVGLLAHIAHKRWVQEGRFQDVAVSRKQSAEKVLP
jgi:hypothetical protein